MSKQRYFWDARRAFKGGTVVEVQPNLWYVDGNFKPQVVATVVDRKTKGNPAVGEVRTIRVDEDFRAISDDTLKSQERFLYSILGEANRIAGDDPKREEWRSRILALIRLPDLGLIHLSPEHRNALLDRDYEEEVERDA